MKGERVKLDIFVHSVYTKDNRVIRHCEALADKNYSVTVFSLYERDGIFKRKVNDVNIFHFPIIRLNKYLGFIGNFLEYIVFFFLSFFINLFRRNHVYINNMPNFYVFSAVVNRMFKKKIILDVHDMMPEIFSINKDIKIVKNFLLLEEKYSHRFADELITVNEGIASYLEERNNRKYFVVYNSALDDKKNDSLVNCSDNKFKLVFHGNIHERYNVHRLFNILPRLKNKFNKLEFHLYGTGPYLPNILELMKRAEFNDYCFYHGSFVPSDIPSILNDKGVGLLLAEKNLQHDLSVSVKFLEYISRYLPVVSSDLVTMVKIFGDKVKFFDASSDESLYRAIEDTIENYDAALARTTKAYDKYSDLCWRNQKNNFIKFIDVKIRGEF